MNSTIKILPQHIADQIAAGEVVERPASVIKECIENAIDANATHIEIYIKNGGKKNIRIIDNGIGMTTEDAEKSVLRHATSKIKNIDDLFSIQSFGFRGEALAAISAVSNFKLITKTIEQDFGSSVEIINNEKSIYKKVPANTGTQIEITDLFLSTPARKQYLKTDATEYREILKEVKAFCLANFNIGFKLFKDGKNVLDFPKTSTKKQRITQVLKKKSDNLTEIKLKLSHLKISGFISRPEHCIGNRNQQYLFVNNRKIHDYKLNFAIREAYNKSCGIEKHLHPQFVIFIEIDPILVDVNVHPRKLEVKFSEPQEIFSGISKAVYDGLSTASQIPNSTLSVNQFQNRNFTSNANYSTTKLTKTFRINSPSPPSVNLFNRSISTKPSFKNYETISNIGEEQLGELILIGQVSHKYIVAENENGVFFFDQHALHERQRFEKFWDKIHGQKIRTQKLLIKQVITLTEEAISILNENKKYINSLGFTFKFPTDESIEISEIPNFLENENLKKYFENFVEFFETESIGEHSLDIFLRKTIEYKACRGAVMFGDKLSKEEMQKILEDLKDTKFKWLCAHGRPNYWFTPFEELDKKFHR